MPDPVDVVVSDPDVPDTSQDKVDVTPAPKPEAVDAEKLASQIKDDFEKLYGSRIKQAEDRLHGAYRIQEKLQKEVDALKGSSPRPTAAEPLAKDPWAGIQDGAVWKSEIERVAEEKAEQKLRTWQAEQMNSAAIAHQHQTLEGSKAQVITRYPDLDPTSGNTDSLVSKAYVSVLAEHPDWLTNPYGPTLAMYAMEEKLIADQKANGSVPTGGPAKPRASLATSTPSRPATSGGERITLTREQKAFCDRNNIAYETYAKTATALEQGAVET